MFANEPDPTGTIDSIISYLMDYGHPFGPSVTTWEEFFKALNSVTIPGSTTLQGTNIQLASWKKFARIMRKFQSEDLFVDKGHEITDRSDLASDLFDNMNPNDVKVIDIAQLDPFMQGFVFGDVIQQVVERMSAKDKNTPDKIVIL